MKKIIFLLTMATSAITFAQENSQEVTQPRTVQSSNDISSRKHELRIDALKLILMPSLEGTYEYIYSQDFTFGANMSLYVGDTQDDILGEKFSLTPFVRFYFQEKQKYDGQGFFVEAFAKYSREKYETESYTEYKYDFENNESTYNTVPSKTDKYDAGSLGMAVGQKWVNKSGVCFEVLAGVGRKIVGSSEALDFTPRVGVNLGYRF
ncbi:MAG: hypothetical protein C4K58_04435 [Flavobacteriaceae bacterium]|nr:MAG: hypothetical protein C4K58_04435 [Flavobacteriaceae bacterium]